MIQRGVMKLGLLLTGRDGYVFVPESYNSSTPSAMIMVMHAAGKDGLTPSASSSTRPTAQVQRACSVLGRQGFAEGSDILYSAVRHARMQYSQHP